MKRDMDLVRKILFKMADNDKHSSYSPGHLKVDGYTQQQVDYHLKMMAQADLLHIDTMEQTSYVSKSPEWTTPKVYVSYYSVSWNGHEFLEPLEIIPGGKKRKALWRTQEALLLML